MKLKQLIDKLNSLPADTVFPNGFGVAQGWRGDYAQIAFNPQANTTAAYMWQCAVDANGAVYEGYKGGRYRMGPDTEVNIAEWGVYGGDSDTLDEARWQLMLAEAQELASPKTRNEDHKALLGGLAQHFAKAGITCGIAEMAGNADAKFEAGKELREAQAALDAILPDGMKT